MMSRLALLLILCLPALSWATPEHALRSAGACDRCHAAPTGWRDPALPLRKCTLSCNGCHVSPTGGGLRNAAGLYYGRFALPAWGPRPAELDTRRIDLLPTSQPTGPASPPTEPVERVPAPGTAGRYGGIEASPTLQIGADLRALTYVPFSKTEQAAVFPMQTDIYLAARPYNPAGLNEGRLTLLLTGGSRGSRGEKYDGFVDRAFVREWYALYDALPYNLYARAGRFLPDHGWRLADHTAFTRQRQRLFGQPYDFERQVTGVEMGVNPNYAYARLSLFNPADGWDQPIKASDGAGGALSVGWRDLAWQVGASTVYGRRGGDDELLYSLQFGANLEVPGWVPFALVYLGELQASHRLPSGGRDITGLSAVHELSATPVQGLTAKLRYDWMDADVDAEFDSRHRLTAGLELNPYPYAQVQLNYRHNWAHTEDRLDTGADEVLVQLHGWY